VSFAGTPAPSSELHWPKKIHPTTQHQSRPADLWNTTWSPKNIHI